MKSILRMLIRVGWVALSCATFLVCLAALGGYWGRVWWRLEQLSHFRVQYFFLLLVSTVVFLVGRRFRSAALAGSFAAANLALIAPLYFGSPPADGAQRTLRAVSFNLFTPNTHREKTLQFIREKKPDIAVFMEENSAWAEALARLASDYPYAHIVPRGDNFGIGLYSRIPFEGVQTVELGEAQVPSIVARIRFDGQPLVIIATHPLPPADATYARLRNEQLLAVADLAQEQAVPVIVLGDLNITSWSPYFDELLKRGGLADSRRGFGVQATWSPFFGPLRIPIDHCLVSSQIKVVNRRVGPDLHSDHLPIIVDMIVGEH